MNHRVTPPLKGGISRALRCLSLLLLPALAPNAGHSLPRARPLADADRRRSEDPPYLCRYGAPPLRFESPTPPPETFTQPAAAAPPIPALSVAESTVAQANAAAAQSTSTTLNPQFPSPESPLAADKSASGAKLPSTATPLPSKPAPTAILPDDTRSVVRPEDFLPFFQIPGAGSGRGELKVIVPISATQSPGTAIPPSSATYTQTPR